MISVVTITFNNFEELKATIDSLKGTKEIELIVINGGECQKTRDFLNAFSPCFPCQIINEKDDGIADAFNKGASLAKGIAITYLNSGDLLKDSTYYEKAKEIFLKNPDVSFIHSDILYDDPMTGVIPVAPKMCSPGRGMPFHHQTMIVKKEVFEKIGNFDLSFRIVMDYDFTLRMLKANYKGYYYEPQTPPILMDGRGVSASQESKSLKESYLTLKKNHFLDFKNIFLYGKRYLFFFIRKALQYFKLNFLIKKIKMLNRLKK